MSNGTRDPNASSETTSTLASHAKVRLLEAISNPTVQRLTQLALVLVLFSGTAMADMGDVYCGTPVERLLNITFQALAGLGLPVAMFFTGRSGLAYMRASSNPNQQNEARKDLILSMVGFGVLILAIVSPEVISKFADAAGFTFSDCVNPLKSSSGP